jgi:hypothetical protein
MRVASFYWGLSPASSGAILSQRAMGRSYWFECSRCGYRARVSGRQDRGVDFFVQTVMCRECKQLYDAVTRLRFSQQGNKSLVNATGLIKLPLSNLPKKPPGFDAALNRVRLTGLREFRWLNFPLQCPVSASHRVQAWSDPGKCPRCAMPLEKCALPYRIWD